MSPADRALVGPLAWTPQQKAQYDVAFFRGLARDRQAQRVYLAKVHTYIHDTPGTPSLRRWVAAAATRDEQFGEPL